LARLRVARVIEACPRCEKFANRHVRNYVLLRSEAAMFASGDCDELVGHFRRRRADTSEAKREAPSLPAFAVPINDGDRTVEACACRDHSGV
jgi:hypothetical protein